MLKRLRFGYSRISWQKHKRKRNCRAVASAEDLFYEYELRLQSANQIRLGKSTENRQLLAREVWRAKPPYMGRLLVGSRSQGEWRDTLTGQGSKAGYSRGTIYGQLNRAL